MGKSRIADRIWELRQDIAGLQQQIAVKVAALDEVEALRSERKPRKAKSEAAPTGEVEA